VLRTDTEVSVGYQLGECDREYPYRYSLVATTDSKSDKTLIVVQCNPSLATNSGSDPTVGKVAIWAESKGFGKVVFLNLFALISSRTGALTGKSYEEVVGPRNNEVMRAQLRRPNCTVVMAWGGDIPVEPELYAQRLTEIRGYLEEIDLVAHHVGALSYGTHPRHGRMWNKGNRDIRVLAWEKICS